MSMNKNRITILIEKVLNNTASKGEQQELDRILSEAPDERLKFEELQQLWNKTRPPQPPVEFDIEREWDNLSGKLGFKDISGEKATHPSSSPLFRLIKKQKSFLAIAATLLVGISITLFWRVNAPTEYLTQNGQRLTILLPDSSVVQLNTASKLIFTWHSADEERQVRLYGEALFDVVHNGQPFRVQTENALVEVLGTQFDVRARQKSTQVQVVSGRVALQNKTADNHRRIILNKNQIGICRGDLPPQAVPLSDSSAVIGWINKKLIFNKTPFKNIKEELQRTFDKRIRILNPQIEELTLTGTFSEEDGFEHILSSICLALHLQVKKVKDEYQISLKP